MKVLENIAAEFEAGKALGRAYRKGQVDFRGITLALAVLAVTFVVLSVMDLVVTGVGLPTALNSSYTEFLDKSGLLIKIGIFGLIIAIVYAFFLGRQ